MSKDSEGRVSHDQNFKNLIIDYPRQAIELFAPSEAQHIQQASITLLRQEQLKDRLGDRFFELDIPLLLQWPNGEREALVFIIEEQTAVSGFSVHKLAMYCLKIAELCKTSRLVPVVIFLNDGKPQNNLALGSECHTFLQFHYLQVILPRLPAKQYFDSSNIVARLNLPNMHYNITDKLAMYASAIRGLESLENNRDQQLKYLEFVDVYSRLSQNERKQFEQYYQKENSTMSGFNAAVMEQVRKEAILQGIEKGIRQGIKQGLEKGVMQGLGLGQRNTLKRQIQRRFGNLSDTYVAKIEQASDDQIQAWLDNVLDAQSIDQVFQ